MSPERVLITGATGLLGRGVLAGILADRPNLRAYVLVRDELRWEAAARRMDLPRDRVEPVMGDIRCAGIGVQPATLRRITTEVSTVLHLAADTVFSRPLDEARATNAQGTANLLEAFEGFSGRFCLVSTAFVAGRHTGRILEADPG